jgi:hypothetical protein
MFKARQVLDPKFTELADRKQGWVLRAAHTHRLADDEFEFGRYNFDDAAGVQ